MTKHRLSWVCALALATAGCGASVAEEGGAPPAGAERPPVVDIAEVRRALAEVDARWEQAANRGDAAGVAALYTPDGRLLPPNADIAQGPEAIRAVIQAYIDAGMSNVDFTSVEVGADGDLAYEVGRYTYELPAPGAGAPLRDEGKYVIIARRQLDGTWKLVADMFNTSLPAGAGN